MSQELIIWILSAVLGGIDLGGFVAVGIIILKGVTKRVEDSTGIKGEVSKLNKNLSRMIEENEKLREENRALILEMKGIKVNAGKRI